jgi:hypothetical protein
MVQDRCVSGKPTGWRIRLFLRRAEKKQTVAQSNDKSSPYHLNLAQICDRQPFFLGLTHGEK